MRPLVWLLVLIAGAQALAGIGLMYVSQDFQQQGPWVQTQQETAQSISGDQKPDEAAQARESGVSKRQHTQSAENAQNAEILGVKRGEWLLFFATLALWWSTRRLVTDAGKQFVKTERPYLFIFDVMLPPRKGWKPERNEADGLEILSASADPPNVLVYDVGNFGNTPATIDGVEIGVAVGVGPPSLLPVPNNHKLVVSDSLRPDKQHNKIAHPMPVEGMVITAGAGAALVIVGGGTLSFRMVVRYHGPFSAGHETSGWWQYDPPSRGFVRHGGSQYNYTR